MKKKNNLLKMMDWQNRMGADEIIVPQPAVFDKDVKAKRQKRVSRDEASVVVAPAATVAMPAVADLSGITTLDQLHQAVMAYEGCSLKASATHTVFADGNPKARVMVVGEAPGAEEDRLGKPFVGRSGQLLDNVFQSIGLDRTCLYISNILPWRPPNNRPPTDAEINQCLPFIEKHIALVRPDFLILAGGTATKSLMKTNQGIMKLRGRFSDYMNPHLSEPIRTLPTFHPAYLLRSPGQKRLVWQDMLLLKKSLAAPA